MKAPESIDPITLELIKKTAAYVPDFEPDGSEYEPTAEKPWQRWLDAKWGFRNHWYPTEASRNIRDGEHKAIKMLGEDILYLRRKGRLYAIEDRCSHRGTRFSFRPVHYTDHTITCWHHAYTFNLDDGRIRCLLNTPNSELCGTKGIKSYPVREEKGIIFTFIGDIEPTPLEVDLPPGFFDDDVAICVADPYVVNSNWRLGSEGGYDPGHHYVHNWSKHAINAKIPMTFGWTSDKETLLKTVTYHQDPNGRNGFVRTVGESHQEMSSIIPGRGDEPEHEVILPILRGQTPFELELLEKLSQTILNTHVSAWLPCGLLVDPWPFPNSTQNEYYVARDDKSHYYFQCGWSRVKSEVERDDWENGELGQVRWKIPTQEDFTVQDAEAREGIAVFYDEEGGWEQEQPSLFDIELLMWRVFAGNNARGIQTEEHALGRFKR